MIRKKYQCITSLTYATDITFAVISFYVAYWLRGTWFSAYERLLPISQYQWMIVFIIPFWSFALYYLGTYRFSYSFSLVKELIRSWGAILIGVICLTAVIFIFKSLYLSRLFIIIFAIVNLLLTSCGRIFITLVSSQHRISSRNIKNIIIVGDGEVAENFARIMHDHRNWGLNLLGFVSESAELTGMVSKDRKVLGSVKDIPALIHQYVVDEVIFTISRKRLEELEDIFLLLEDEGINARIMLNIFPHMIAKVHLDEIDNVPLLTFTTLPTNEFALFLKRVIDIVISIFAILLFSPVVLVIAALIKFTSPGAIIFVQRRCGLNGRIFNFYKFRSMYDDAESRKLDYMELNEVNGPIFKIKNDPRITSVGRFLRKTSLDELPQFWNVLKGDMSVVGPRPPLPQEVEKYQRWERRRLSMRPGITCLWQISGRSLLSFDEWIKLDLKYIDSWSLRLDFKILLKTLPVVILGKGAY